MPTAEIEAIRAAVVRRFPDVVDGGVDNCRKIAGSSSWSQHAYGNAWDIFGPGSSSSKADQDYLDRVYRYLRDNPDRLPVDNLCWKSHGGCNAATHQDHIHVTGPVMRGTPECAGGTPQQDSDRSWRDWVPPHLRLPGLGFAPPGVPTPDDAGAAAVGPVEAAGRAAVFLADPANWRRIGIGVAGAALLLVALVMLARDLAPRAAAEVVAGAVSSGA